MRSDDADPELDFSLPETGAEKRGRVRWDSPAVLLGAVLALTALNVALTVALRPGGSLEEGTELGSEALRDLALKLEKQGLEEAAATTWAEYLDRAGGSSAEAARIWYRRGKLHQEAGRYEDALACYYRSEALHPDDELAPELGKRVQESLERMGKFAALRRELTERVSLDPGAGEEGDEVVAEIGTEAITRTQLERHLEAHIEDQLRRFGPGMPEEVRRQRKEELFRQLSTAEAKMQFLQSHLAEELLVRKALAGGLAEKSEVKRRLREAERELLASLILERQIEDRVRVTEAELRSYFQEHEERYSVPGQEGAEPEPRPFEEVRAEVYRDLRAERERQVQERFLRGLRDEFDVVIHHDRLGLTGEDEEPSNDP